MESNYRANLDGSIHTQQTFGSHYIDIDSDPILGRVVCDMDDAVGLEPLVNKIKRLVSWLDKLINFLVSQMLHGVREKYIST